MGDPQAGGLIIAAVAALEGKQEADMVYTTACPFEPGAVDEQALAATGAREVTGVATGFNLPAGRIEAAEDSEMFEDLYDSNV